MESSLPMRKSKEDIEFYLSNGRFYGDILKELYFDIAVGNLTTGLAVQNRFESLIARFAIGEISFPFRSQKNYLSEPFNNAICVSINDTVAHGIPNEKEFKTGDIVSIDTGITVDKIARPLYFDAGFTVKFDSEEQPEWMLAPSQALRNIINEQPMTTYRTAEVIHETAIQNNLDTVVLLTGHGIGYAMHEPPYIRNAPGKYSNTGFFEGLCFCAEPIFVLPEEQREVPLLARAYVDSDGWSVRTENNQPGSHFETMFCINNGELVDICGITEWFY